MLHLEILPVILTLYSLNWLLFSLFNHKWKSDLFVKAASTNSITFDRVRVLSSEGAKIVDPVESKRPKREKYSQIFKNQKKSVIKAIRMIQKHQNRQIITMLVYGTLARYGLYFNYLAMMVAKNRPTGV
jgi:hypothetical protein